MNGTPGKWEASIVTGPDGKDWIGVGEAGRKYPRMDKVIALCGPVGGAFEEDSIADAKKVAAAPDLIEACNSVMVGLENGKGSIPFMITMLRGALTKAGAIS